MTRKGKIIVEPNGNRIEIIGNGHYRDIIYGFELTDKEREWYNGLLDDETIDEGSFFRYYGQVYYLGDFMSIHNRFYNPNPPDWQKGYDGYLTDSLFSGILIKYAGEPNDIDYGEFIQVYTFISLGQA